MLLLVNKYFVLIFKSQNKTILEREQSSRSANKLLGTRERGFNVIRHRGTADQNGGESHFADVIVSSKMLSGSSKDVHIWDLSWEP